MRTKHFVVLAHAMVIGISLWRIDALLRINMVPISAPPGLSLQNNNRRLASSETYPPPGPKRLTGPFLFTSSWPNAPRQ